MTEPRPDRDALPETAPMVMPWMLDCPDAKARARRRAVHRARQAAVGRASALTRLVVPPPLPR